MQSVSRNASDLYFFNLSRIRWWFIGQFYCLDVFLWRCYLSVWLRCLPIFWSMGGKERTQNSSSYVFRKLISCWQRIVVMQEAVGRITSQAIAFPVWQVFCLSSIVTGSITCPCDQASQITLLSNGEFAKLGRETGVSYLVWQIPLLNIYCGRFNNILMWLTCLNRAGVRRKALLETMSQRMGRICNISHVWWYLYQCPNILRAMQALAKICSNPWNATSGR